MRKDGKCACGSGASFIVTDSVLVADSVLDALSSKGNDDPLVFAVA